MCEGLMELAKKNKYIWAENQLLQKKSGASYPSKVVWLRNMKEQYNFLDLAL